VRLLQGDAAREEELSRVSHSDLQRDVFHCKRCGVCKKAQYCSPICQKDDWAEGHKEDCGKDKGLPFSNPKPKAVVAARNTGLVEDGVFVDRLTEQELHTWNNEAYWSENEKHLLQELWKTFDRDGQVPIEVSTAKDRLMIAR
jgi:hypothetical protein